MEDPEQGVRATPRLTNGGHRLPVSECLFELRIHSLGEKCHRRARIALLSNTIASDILPLPLTVFDFTTFGDIQRVRTSEPNSGHPRQGLLCTIRSTVSARLSQGTSATAKHASEGRGSLRILEVRPSGSIQIGAREGLWIIFVKAPFCGMICCETICKLHSFRETEAVIWETKGAGVLMAVLRYIGITNSSE